ncbi:sulfatase [Polaribacter reichenbachii]|uniref:Sulfatase n=1 Tax=Polaribacter reichenbachii TaxID=996801 RepID=A0A1B8TUH1_9FLAO|nr:sulfatase-like hydrolase/transferase [Polaribacter reichenbachii]APZ45528.1 sulfatase [Polaribacter reichenbachii]AUC19390.1 sulfatase [Polaribacter reichenbachii]OBY63456.1 sulfatase [Polaribacter reichenbachii]
MKNLIKSFGLMILFLTVSKTVNAQEQQPNILYILTDDQRYDSVKTFNQEIDGREMSELGYIESPEVDKLAAQGTTFINTYVQAAGCAPSRAVILQGRYPFRSGVYEFEYHNNKAEHMKPSLPEQMVDLGYQTFHVGKLGYRLKGLSENGKTKDYKVFQTDINFRPLGKEGFTDYSGGGWWNKVDGVKYDKPIKDMSFFVTPEGKFEYVSKQLNELTDKYKNVAKETTEKYDLIRHYKKGQKKSMYKGMIISGVSPRKAGKTRDGYYAHFLNEYLVNEKKQFSAGKLNFQGVDPSKPVFAHIGFDFPHTPVLPPADFRARFQKHKYNVPEFSDEEFVSMAKQMKRQVNSKPSYHFTDKEKQKMIQDYYAFCAYGDQLVGKATKDFVAYSEKHNQPWMIIYVCGDHGWKLNEHGGVSKFTPWKWDTHNPMIVVSSDKKKFPAGKVVKRFTEFVDIAPTALSAAGADLNADKYSYLDGLDLAKTVAKKAPKRDYIIGESHAVTGPRAYIRTKDYVLSLKTRPNKKEGENMEWALSASWQDLDPALYDLNKDPREVNNVAFQKEYQKIAKQMKEKLLNIVLGDNRVEINWGKWGTGTKIYRSNFAQGAHDFKLHLK